MKALSQTVRSPVLFEERKELTLSQELKIAPERIVSLFGPTISAIIALTNASAVLYGLPPNSRQASCPRWRQDGKSRYLRRLPKP